MRHLMELKLFNLGLFLNKQINHMMNKLQLSFKLSFPLMGTYWFWRSVTSISFENHLMLVKTTIRKSSHWHTHTQGYREDPVVPWASISLNHDDCFRVNIWAMPGLSSSSLLNYENLSEKRNRSKERSRIHP